MICGNQEARKVSIDDGTDHIDYPAFELQAARASAALITRMMQNLD